ncbi:MAG: type II toxin-antitoxin system RelE/ParE family toxin [Selenomonadaceae bacterium]|nr:type II toxin-antitoxin system RelE/ParE family toxin [Selenomonadaceae bacterium]MDY2686086.1 type II toxin-antitoxin system RelE/ParE family toxin [Selenomonadaceae bacterium]
MYELHITAPAEQDLEGIIAYQAEKLKNPEAATAFLDRLEEVYAYLRKNPYIYAKCRDSVLEKAGYRTAQVKKYLLVYRIIDEVVIVYRFFHGTQAYTKVLGGDR